MALVTVQRTSTSSSVSDLLFVSLNQVQNLSPFYFGSGYFAVNGILPLETILP